MDIRRIHRSQMEPFSFIYPIPRISGLPDRPDDMAFRG